jgi:hypothetical protein
MPSAEEQPACNGTGQSGHPGIEAKASRPNSPEAHRHKPVQHHAAFRTLAALGEGEPSIADQRAAKAAGTSFGIFHPSSGHG